MSARDALIASVTGLVRRRGVAGTGLNALLEDSGVARRTVYLNFPGGKAELVAEATRRAGEALSTAIRSADDGGDPAQELQTFIAGWEARQARRRREPRRCKPAARWWQRASAVPKRRRRHRRLARPLVSGRRYSPTGWARAAAVLATPAPL